MIIQDIQRIVKNTRSRAENMAIICQHADPEILKALRTDKSGNRLNKILYHPGYKFKRRDPITIGSRTIIPLTQGLTTIVDTEHVHLVKDHLWYASKVRNIWYAVHYVRQDDGAWLPEFIHRVLCEAVNGPIAPNFEIDHKNNDSLNNKLSNLRAVTRRVNAQNSQRRNAGQTSSKYPGVSWHSRNKKWASLAKFGSIQYHLGYYDEEKSAYQARLLALAAHNDFGILPPHKTRKPAEEEE